MLAFYARNNLECYGSPGGPLHDPCVIAWLLQPGLFRGKRAHVSVETDSALSMGRTVDDWWDVTGATPNATVMDHVETKRFYALVMDRLSRL